MTGIRKKILIISGMVICIFIAFLIIFNNKGRKTDIIPPVSDTPAPVSDTLSLPNEVFLTEFFDFESGDLLMSDNSISSEQAVSGTKSLKFTPALEFGATHEKKLDHISNIEGLREIQVNFKLFATQPLEEVLVVVTIEDPSGQNQLWIGNPVKTTPGKWMGISSDFEITSASLKKENKLKVYFWNKSKNTFYVDDIQLVFSGVVKRFVMHSVPVPERNIFYDFEVPFDGDNPENFSSEYYRSGGKSFLLNGKTSYSPSIVKRVNEVIDSELKLVTLSVWLYPMKANPDVVLVVSLKDAEGKEYSWNGRSSEKGKFTAREWTKHRAQFKLPFEQIRKDDIISAYLWNKSGTDVYVDDMEVVYGETNVRSGEKPLLDMTQFVDKEYSFPVNRSPFRSAFLSKVSIPGLESGYLINNNEVKKGEINPFQPVVAGSFVKGQHSLHQLFCIENRIAVIYSFCPEKQQFQKLVESKVGLLPEWVSDAGVFSCDLNGDNIDEVLVSGHSGEQLFLLSVEGLLGGCQNGTKANSSISVLYNSDQDAMLKELTGKGFTFITGDFNNNGKSEILAVNSATGGYRIVEYDKEIFRTELSVENNELFASGLSNKNISLTAFSPGKGEADLLLITYEHKGRDIIKIAGRRNNTGPLAEKNGFKIPVHLFNNKTQFYTGNFSGDGSLQILINSTDWRFDLKLAEINGQELNVKYNLDFAGYGNSENPKFYECRKFITGKFTQPITDEILAITRNCDDDDYNGLHCRKYTSTGMFVPVIQLFNLKANTER